MPAAVGLASGARACVGMQRHALEAPRPGVPRGVPAPLPKLGAISRPTGDCSTSAIGRPPRGANGPVGVTKARQGDAACVRHTWRAFQGSPGSVPAPLNTRAIQAGLTLGSSAWERRQLGSLPNVTSMPPKCGASASSAWRYVSNSASVLG